MYYSNQMWTFHDGSVLLLERVFEVLSIPFVNDTIWLVYDPICPVGLEKLMVVQLGLESNIVERPSPHFSETLGGSQAEDAVSIATQLPDRRYSILDTPHGPSKGTTLHSAFPSSLVKASHRPAHDQTRHGRVSMYLGITTGHDIEAGKATTARLHREFVISCSGNVWA